MDITFTDTDSQIEPVTPSNCFNSSGANDKISMKLDSTCSTATGNVQSSGSSHGFSSGVLAGVGAGVGVPLLIAVLTLIFFLVREKKKVRQLIDEMQRQATKAPMISPPYAEELAGNPISELHAISTPKTTSTSADPNSS